MTTPLTFTGVAHPPPRAVRAHPSDLSTGELVGTRIAGLPIHIEHDTSRPSVGHVLTSYEGARGEMKVIGQVTDTSTAARVVSGELRGLSLGTDCVQSMDGNVLSRHQKELSLCEEGRRSGTWITDIAGKRVHEIAAFSKNHGLRTTIEHHR